MPGRTGPQADASGVALASSDIVARRRSSNNQGRSVRIGTSGWHYKHWVGPFYPETTPPARMLDLYTRQFDTVELNTTFYRLPPERAAAEWARRTPADFLFAAKGSRFITHMKKLRDPALALSRYFERLEGLGPKLGPIVFQLPPKWSVDVDRLSAFLDALPRPRRYAFEFRDPTWNVPAVYDLLRAHGAAYCIFELAGFLSPLEITADFSYIRLHGPGGKYQGSYSDATLADWASRIRSWGLPANFIYFDNDQAGYAAANARRLEELLAVTSL
jgi:uncharacterized protein YecE (DUF72 family)